jgi:hypothetical protein
LSDLYWHQVGSNIWKSLASNAGNIAKKKSQKKEIAKTNCAKLPSPKVHLQDAGDRRKLFEKVGDFLIDETMGFLEGSFGISGLPGDAAWIREVMT